MRDLLFVIATLAFFAVSVGLVRGCDLLIGPDELGEELKPDVELQEAA